MASKWRMWFTVIWGNKRWVRLWVTGSGLLSIDKKYLQSKRDCYGCSLRAFKSACLQVVVE